MAHSRKDMINELKKISKGNDIQREVFRDSSSIPERSWRNEFGTWNEFKKQAGIIEPASVKIKDSIIAKHSSLDILRAMTKEKRGYAGKYLKPKGNRFQTVLVGSDIHDIECDPFWRAMFLTAAKRVQPEKVILNGDLFDLPEFSKYSVDPRDWDVVGRIKWVHKFLEELRQAVPNAEISLIEGNHELRLLRHLSEATPALKSILSDLHSFTVPKLLGIDKYEINYVAPADLATLTKTDERAELRRNFLIMYDCLVAHHFPEGRSFGMPGFNGHHHSHVVDTFYNPTFGSYEWHQLGSGHKREASYCNGEKWSNGFALVHVDTLAKKIQFEYIDTTNDHVVFGGEWYTRGD